MPANLTPEYRTAEAAFRKARDPGERLQWLREMLRVIPKHKGTDHLQGDIKRRIKELSDELERPKKGGARGGPAARHPARGRGADRADRSPERGQVITPFPAHGLRGSRRGVPLHDSASRARDDALRGHSLP